MNSFQAVGLLDVPKMDPFIRSSTRAKDHDGGKVQPLCPITDSALCEGTIFLKNGRNGFMNQKLGGGFKDFCCTEMIQFD